MTTPRQDIVAPPDATGNSVSPAGDGAASPPPMTTRIAQLVATAAREKLNMDDCPDDFVIWLKSFTP